MLSKRQARSLAASDGRVNLWVGAIRSGKTYVSILRFFMAVAAVPQGGEIVIVGKNRDSIYRNFFRVIEEAAGLSALKAVVEYRQGAPTAIILGRTVHVIGANDAKAEAKIRGMTVILAYVDEVTVIPSDFFRQLLGRMSPPEAQLFGTTNPDTSRHWLKVDYLDQAAKLHRWRVFHFTMEDNPSLTSEYKDALRAEFTGVWFQRFILGMWVAAEGAIFDAYNPAAWTDGGNFIPWGDLAGLTPVELLGAGIDYGTTNATAAIRLAYYQHPTLGPILVALDEYRYEKKKTGRAATDVELSHAIVTHLATPAWPGTGPITRPTRVAVDPAAASFRAQLQRDGIHTTPAVNDVLTGLRRVNSLLAARRLFVTDRCAGLLDELPAYRWDDKAAAAGEDKPVKEDDHSVDAFRYAVMSTEHRWRYPIDTAIKEATL